MPDLSFPLANCVSQAPLQKLRTGLLLLTFAVGPNDFSHMLPTGDLRLKSVMAGQIEEKRYHGHTLPQWRAVVKEEHNFDVSEDDKISALISVVADTDAPFNDRRRFALTLGRLGEKGEPAVPLLTQLLNNNEADRLSTQLMALKALGLMGPPAVKAAPATLRIVQDRSLPFLVRSSAMEALAQIAPDQRTTLPVLISLLRSDQQEPKSHDAEELRRSAAEAIALLGPNAVPAIPELVRALQSDWEVLQRSAATALGALGPRGEPALHALMDVVLFGEAVDSREAAADALANIGKPALPVLEILSRDEEEIVRRLGIRGLQRSTAGIDGVAILRKTLSDNSLVVRVEGAAALFQFQRDASAEVVLLEGLRSSGREPRVIAYRALRLQPMLLTQLRPELQEISEDRALHTQSREAAEKLLELID